MEILIVKDGAELADVAASIIRRQVEQKPASVLGLATGSTPENTYARLVKAHKEDGVDFSQVRTFNLDEYLGLARDHDQSYHYFMHDRLFNHINVKAENINLPDGMAPDPDGACQAYEEQIRAAGGIDLQLLGVGTNGHIAFNEPGSSLASRTQVKTLTEITIMDNARLFFNGNEADVPRFAITMGVGTILEARQLLLLASGERKAGIVRDFIEGPVTASVTASALQLHPKVTVVLDEAAAGMLERRDYMRWVQAQKLEYARLCSRLAAQ